MSLSHIFSVFQVSVSQELENLVHLISWSWISTDCQLKLQLQVSSSRFISWILRSTRARPGLCFFALRLWSIWQTRPFDRLASQSVIFYTHSKWFLFLEYLMFNSGRGFTARPHREHSTQMMVPFRVLRIAEQPPAKGTSFWLTLIRAQWGAMKKKCESQW